MAMSTREGNHDAPKQHDTHAVGKQGDQPKVAAATPAEPTLPDGIDPVLLVRLYPEEANLAACKAAALAQGKKTAEDAVKLEATLHAPMVPPPEPAPAHRA